MPSAEDVVSFQKLNPERVRRYHAHFGLDEAAASPPSNCNPNHEYMLKTIPILYNKVPGLTDVIDVQVTLKAVLLTEHEYARLVAEMDLTAAQCKRTEVPC